MESGGHVASQRPAGRRRPAAPGSSCQRIVPSSATCRRPDVVVGEQRRDRRDALAAVGDQQRVEARAAAAPGGGGGSGWPGSVDRPRAAGRPGRPNAATCCDLGLGHLAVRRVGHARSRPWPPAPGHRRRHAASARAAIGVVRRQRGKARAPLGRGVAHDPLRPAPRGGSPGRRGPAAPRWHRWRRRCTLTPRGGRHRADRYRRAAVERARAAARHRRRGPSGRPPPPCCRLVAGVARQQLEIGPADVEQRQLRRIRAGPRPGRRPGRSAAPADRPWPAAARRRLGQRVERRRRGAAADCGAGAGVVSCRPAQPAASSRAIRPNLTRSTHAPPHPAGGQGRPELGPGAPDHAGP